MVTFVFIINCNWTRQIVCIFVLHLLPLLCMYEGDWHTHLFQTIFNLHIYSWFPPENAKILLFFRRYYL